MTAIAPEKLSFQPGDATWHKLRAKGLNDLYFFTSVILGYGPKVPMKDAIHKGMCRVIERKTGHPAVDSKKYRLVLMPRGGGKTTVITQGYAIQRLCRNPSDSILLANEKAETASDMLSEIKQAFESNSLLRTLYPEAIPPDFNKTTWSTTRITVNRTESRKEPSCFVIGVGGTVTGMHPNGIIVDDMISREAATAARFGNWRIMENVNSWIHTLEPLLAGPQPGMPDPEITFIGTRWFYNDCYDHIVEAFGYGEEPVTYQMRVTMDDGITTQMLPVTCVGDLVIFKRQAIEQGRSWWPDNAKYDIEGLAKQRMTDAAFFAANYMNEPADEATAVFKESWLQYYDITASGAFKVTDSTGKEAFYQSADLDIVMSVDPGGFGVKSGADRMRPAVMVTGTTPNDQHLILEAYSEQDTFMGCAETILSFASQYHPRKVAIEQAGQQAAFIELVRRLAKERGVSLYLEPVPAGTKQKDDRILELESYFQRGQIWIGKGPKFAEWQDQYRLFPRSARKDLLDAMAHMPKVWRRPAQRGGMEDIRKQQQQALARYRESRQ